MLTVPLHNILGSGLNIPTPYLDFKIMLTLKAHVLCKALGRWVHTAAGGIQFFTFKSALMFRESMLGHLLRSQGGHRPSDSQASLCQDTSKLKLFFTCPLSLKSDTAESSLNPRYKNQGSHCISFPHPNDVSIWHPPQRK